MSLPYGLKGINPFRTNTLYSLTGIQTDDNSNRYLGGVYSHGLYMSWQNFKPILYPLSYLTTSIDGEPAFFRYFDDFKKELINVSYGDGDVYELPFNLLNRMVKWHFDIAGLIEKGEAIDINTLETNPYK